MRLVGSFVALAATGLIGACDALFTVSRSALRPRQLPPATQLYVGQERAHRTRTVPPVSGGDSAPATTTATSPNFSQAAGAPTRPDSTPTLAPGNIGYIVPPHLPSFEHVLREILRLRGLTEGQDYKFIPEQFLPIPLSPQALAPLTVALLDHLVPDSGYAKFMKEVCERPKTQPAFHALFLLAHFGGFFWLRGNLSSQNWDIQVNHNQQQPLIWAAEADCYWADSLATASNDQHLKFLEAQYDIPSKDLAKVVEGTYPTVDVRSFRLKLESLDLTTSTTADLTLAEYICQVLGAYASTLPLEFHTRVGAVRHRVRGGPSTELHSYKVKRRFGDLANMDALNDFAKAIGYQGNPSDFDNIFFHLMRPDLAPSKSFEANGMLAITRESLKGNAPPPVSSKE